ncbi:MAG: hypothetical protein KGJ19_02060 [Betaproteobacteria bacterium]|nr:hypothetical protein [Betaproteobacteria bacterium]
MLLLFCSLACVLYLLHRLSAGAHGIIQNARMKIPARLIKKSAGSASMPLEPPHRAAVNLRLPGRAPPRKMTRRNM